MNSQAYLCGYWLGDGTKSQRRPTNEPMAHLLGIAKDLPRVEKALLRLDWKIHSWWAKTRVTPVWTISLRDLYYLLRDNGLWDNVPLDLVYTTEYDQRAAVVGFFDADGNISLEEKKGRKNVVHIRLTGINRVQIEAVQRILEGFLVETGLYELKDKRPNRQLCYQLKVRQISIDDFLALFPLQVDKMKRLEKKCSLL